MRRRINAVALALLLAIAAVGPASAKTCPSGRSGDGAMWLSILHAGTGEWFLNGWGSFETNAPQKKFWLGWIPIYGYGYLTVVSAIDSANCRTDDSLRLD
jgi:hypothetical protein